jgi:hypothetical protein
MGTKHIQIGYTMYSDRFSTHELGLVPCFGPGKTIFALWWLTMVMAILRLGDDVSGVAPPYLPVYTKDKKPPHCYVHTWTWFLILGVYGKKWLSYTAYTALKL